MIEWGNNWARAINYRSENEEAFAGFFSQIGRLYNVHHIWGIIINFFSPNYLEKSVNHFINLKCSSFPVILTI